MTLVLQIENYRTLDNGSPVQFTVPAQGAKVGRSAAMDWSLPDPTRHISSHHFDIVAQDGAFYLRDVSTNGTYLYHTRERINGVHRLNDGDRVQVGTYVICAAIQERTQIVSQDKTVFMAQPSQSVPPAQLAPAPVQPPPPPQQPMAQSQPVAPVVPPAQPPQPPQYTPPPAQAAPPPPPTPEVAPPTPSYPDPVAPPPMQTPTSVPPQVAKQPAPPEPVVAPPPSPEPKPEVAAYTPPPEPVPSPEVPPAEDRSPWETMPPTAAELSSEPEAELEPEPILDPLPEGGLPEVSLSELIPDDPFLADDPFEMDRSAAGADGEDQTGTSKPDFARIFEDVDDGGVQKPPQADKTGFGDPTPVQAPPSVQIPDLDFIADDLSAPSIPPTDIEDNEITGQLSLPPHTLMALEQAAAEKRETSAPPTPKSKAPSDLDPILSAFCRGAGVPEDMAAGIDPEVLAEALGQSVKVTTSEVMDMLEARASTKHFARIGERTTPNATNSNPLKFLPDAEQALEVMFLGPKDGYQEGSAAFEEALGNLRTHQKALFAAIQPALMKMLDGLSPDEIEAELSSSLMSGSGRAWERFRKLYIERTEGHENGMLDVFLTHYAEAYKAIVDRQTN